VAKELHLAGRQRKPLIAATAGILVVLLLVAVAVRLSPLLGPAPDLPTDATRLHIDTEAPQLMPTMGCPTALLAPARVATAEGALILLSVATGARVPVVWPSGWVAWRVDGRAALVARDGSVVAWEGDVIEDRFGGGVGLDDVFHVCIIGG
jgi:hypothetical protein